MKFCYCDESGTGDEPIAVMVGIIVDAARMHLTKADWEDLLASLSSIAGRRIGELHTRDFYAGNSVWRSVDGQRRSRIITQIFKWLADRKHSVVYSAVTKQSYFDALDRGDIPDELNTPWRFIGFHLVLAVQRVHQSLKKNKGNTLFIFDNEERERLRFTDLIARPPGWSDTYYGRKTKEPPLSQVIDVPYFADSRDVGLTQLADLASFFLRRYIEIKEGHSQPKYEDEPEKGTAWAKALSARSIGRDHIYLTKGRCKAAELFFQYAPPTILAV